MNTRRLAFTSLAMAAAALFTRHIIHHGDIR
jgi:hypothetical protein